MHSRRHLKRAGLLLGGALLGFFIVRALLVPSSFGKYGNFRGDNLTEQATLPTNYGPPDICASCHQEKMTQHARGRHVTVPCQTCHGPVSMHVQDDGMKPMAVSKSFTLCARCHQKIEARPRDFPQINIHDHLFAMGQKTDGNEEICLKCHNPHSPTPK